MEIGLWKTRRAFGRERLNEPRAISSMAEKKEKNFLRGWSPILRVFKCRSSLRASGQESSDPLRCIYEMHLWDDMG